MNTDLTKAKGQAVFPIYWLVYFGLIAYSALVVLNTGDIGFQGDDFWYLSAPFSHGFWQAFVNYVMPYDRPFGFVYIFSLFKLFGFSRVPYLALDFFLQATTSLFFGLVLSRVFPRHNMLIFFSMLFSFFLLPSSSSLYVMAMTVPRLGCLIFWVSIFMFQWWARKPSWLRLFIPVMLYCASFLLYDSTSLLILTAPLFVYPVWYRNQNNPDVSLGEIYAGLVAKLRLSITGKINPLRQSEIIFIIRLATGLFISIGLLLINLLIFFPFGASRIQSSSIDPSLLIDYLFVFPQYLIAPFSRFLVDGWTWVICISLFVFLLGILFRRHEPDQLSVDRSSRDTSWQFYAIVMGLALSITGIFPFIVAQYGASVGFTTHGRIFFSAIYGLAILLSVIITGGKSYTLRWFLELTGVVVIVASAAFLADLRLDWRSAARINCTLWSSMVEQVPAVKKDTVFLFLDLQSYYQDGEIVPVGNRAVVFASVDALPLYIQMLYGDSSLKAYYLYPPRLGQSLLQAEGRTATVTLTGVTARWSPELLVDKIIIMERRGDHLEFVDKLTASDGKAAIMWKDGVNELVSNRDQIIRGDISSERYEIIWGHACR
jgi:hypothetical protein